MSVLIIEEKPPHFTDVEFEYKGIEFQAQICLLDTGKVMISFRHDAFYSFPHQILLRFMRNKSPQKSVYFCERKRSFIQSNDGFQLVTSSKDVVFMTFKYLWESCCYQRRTSRKRKTFYRCSIVLDGNRDQR